MKRSENCPEKQGDGENKLVKYTTNKTQTIVKLYQKENLIRNAPEKRATKFPKKKATSFQNHHHFEKNI